MLAEDLRIYGYAYPVASLELTTMPNLAFRENNKAGRNSGNAVVIDTVFMKPARNRNSKSASILQRPSPWLRIFRYMRSLSHDVRVPRFNTSTTALLIASSC